MVGHWINAVDHSTLREEDQRRREISEQQLAEESRRAKELNEDIRKYSIAEVFERMARRKAGQKLTSPPTFRMTIMNDTTTDQQEETPRTSPAPRGSGSARSPIAPGHSTIVSDE